MTVMEADDDEIVLEASGWDHVFIPSPEKSKVRRKVWTEMVRQWFISKRSFGTFWCPSPLPCYLCSMPSREMNLRWGHSVPWNGRGCPRRTERAMMYLSDGHDARRQLRWVLGSLLFRRKLLRHGLHQ